MEVNLDRGAHLPDGVLVVRAVTQGGAEPHRIFRLTMGTGTDAEPAVVVVSTVQDLHQAIDDWVSALAG